MEKRCKQQMGKVSFRGVQLSQVYDYNYDQICTASKNLITKTALLETFCRVSYILSISMFPLIMIDSCSNLFLKELILSCPIIRQFVLFILKSFRKDCGSFSSPLFQLIRRVLNEAFPVLRVAFNTILLF